MRLPHLAAITGAALACTACVSVETVRADAEAVFREHNRVAGEVMLVLADPGPDNPDSAALAAADRSMLAACEPLNDVAIAHREGRRPTLRQRLALPAAIDACRDATASAASLLANQQDS